MAPDRVLRASLTFRNPFQLLWVSLSPHTIRVILGSRGGCPTFPSTHRAYAWALTAAQAAGRRHSDPEPVPTSLARGQTGPAQSPRTEGHTQLVEIPQSELHSGAGLRDRCGGREQSPGTESRARERGERQQTRRTREGRPAVSGRAQRTGTRWRRRRHGSSATRLGAKRAARGHTGRG